MSVRLERSIAAALACALVALVLVTPGGPESPGPIAVAVVLAVVQGATVAVVRHRPEQAMAVALVAGAGLEALSPHIGWLGQAAAVLSGYAWVRSPRRSLWVLGVMVAATPWKLATGDWRNLLLAIAGPALGWTLGELGRTRGLRRQELERRIVAQERARISRELHDVLAHTVSVIVVQASAAEDAFDRRPDLARQALGSIGTAARTTLDELRLLLRSMSAAQDDDEPQPGLDRLDELIRSLGAAGLRVELSGDTTGDVPAAVGLSAYRIVQESLTNTLRHSRSTRARVVVSTVDGRVRLYIQDDGPPRVTGRVDGSGRHGSGGRRERARLRGGALEAGPGPGGGFRVRADLPVTR